jgi:hypothetical protein
VVTPKRKKKHIAERKLKRSKLKQSKPKRSKPKRSKPKQTLPQDRLTALSEHTLGFFSATAADALEQLGEKRPQAGTVFAVVNTLTADQAMRNLRGISQSRAQELRVLSTEPAIARIVVAEQSGDKKTYFISRAAPSRPPRDGSAVASSRPLYAGRRLPSHQAPDRLFPEGIHASGFDDAKLLNDASSTGSLSFVFRMHTCSRSCLELLLQRHHGSLPQQLGVV